MAKENKINTAKHDFESAGFLFKTISRDIFYEYLDKTTAEKDFLPSDNQAGAIIIDDMAMDTIPDLKDIRVGELSFGMLMNFTYNEDPFFFQGYYQNNITTKWYPRNVANTP